MPSDLHCHTKLSDGSMGIEDILTLAQKQGVTTLAITDHDCMAGTVRAKIIGDRNGVNVIPGVELSASDNQTGDEIHILCYFCDSPDRLEGLCHRNLVARKKAAQYMMIKTQHKYPVSGEFILRCAQGSTNIYPVHIMSSLVESGITTEICGELYNELFGNGVKLLFKKPEFETPEKVLQAIHEAGGIAVLAHPGCYSSTQVIDRLVALGLDGIEVWSPKHDEQQTADFLQYAKENKLLATGGSNFHGRYNESCVSLGSYSTPDKQLSELLGYKAKLRRKNKAST